MPEFLHKWAKRHELGIRKLDCWIGVILKGAKVVVIIPLGGMGATAFLRSVHYGLFSWFLVVLLAFYVVAEFVESYEKLGEHLDTRTKGGA